MKRRKRKSPLDNHQDAVLHDYRSSHGKQSDALHMFFSPDRIPVGLTDEEVQICINLYPLRETQEKRRVTRELGKDEIPFEDPMINLGRVARAITNKASLPTEFELGKVMTRSRFKKAIWVFLKQAHL